MHATRLWLILAFVCCGLTWAAGVPWEWRMALARFFLGGNELGQHPLPRKAPAKVKSSSRGKAAPHLGRAWRQRRATPTILAASLIQRQLPDDGFGAETRKKEEPKRTRRAA